MDWLVAENMGLVISSGINYPTSGLWWWLSGSEQLGMVDKQQM